MKSFLSPDHFPPPPREFRAPYDTAGARLGDGLKTMFHDMTAQPMPDRLVQLAQALEEAFERGDLFERCGKLDA